MLEDPILGLCCFCSWDLENKYSGVDEGEAVLLTQVFSHCLPTQGDQDDRSYKQCRTSSPSSAGSVSLGHYTPTSRSPQHYSRPGIHPTPLILTPDDVVLPSEFADIK